MRYGVTRHAGSGAFAPAHGGGGGGLPHSYGLREPKTASDLIRGGALWLQRGGCMRAVLGLLKNTETNGGKGCLRPLKKSHSYL